MPENSLILDSRGPEADFDLDPALGLWLHCYIHGLLDVLN